MHRKTYHIAVFAPKINAESEKYLPFPVQYYRKFIYSKFFSKKQVVCTKLLHKPQTA